MKRQELPERRVVRVGVPNGAAGYVGVTADAAWRCREVTHPLIDWGRRKAPPVRCTMGA